MNTSFEVCNVLKSLLNLILWHGFAVWFRPVTLDKVFSICHLILKQYFSAPYTKISFLTPYMVVLKFNINDMYLNLEVPADDQDIEILPYHIFCTDCPSNNKRGCFFKSGKYLSFSECISFE